MSDDLRTSGRIYALGKALEAAARSGDTNPITLARISERAIGHAIALALPECPSEEYVAGMQDIETLLQTALASRLGPA